jgi:hypothetical protein
MSAPRPLLMTWDGEALRPATPYWQRVADEQFVIGERLQIVRHEERSGVSHRHYFAAVHEAWTNLPDELAVHYPSSDHLRKHALIATGYRDERRIACSSVAEARKVAAFVSPMDEYAVVSVRGDVVIVATAKSQSARAMPKGEFQRSKQACLEYVWSLVGVTPEEGSANTGKAA